MLTEYEYEYHSVFEKHQIIRYSNIFGPNYSNIFEYRIIRSPLVRTDLLQWNHIIPIYSKQSLGTFRLPVTSELCESFNESVWSVKTYIAFTINMVPTSHFLPVQPLEVQYKTVNINRTIIVT